MQQRRLAAIMFSDIVGYTSQMGKDEKKAFDVLKKNRRIHWRLIKKYKGRLLKEMGDGILACFSSNIDAVMCALSIQNATKELDIPLRIGIHLGDVIFENKDVLGDGVNVASRIQSSAETHGIVISETVNNDIKNKEGLEIEFLRKQQLKGVESEIGIYKVDCHDSSMLDFTIDTGELVKPIQMNTKTLLIGFLIITVLSVTSYLILKKVAGPYPEFEKSIAVLPFFNDSPDPDNEYLCNGMMDEILNQLVIISDINVKSRTSVEKYRNQMKDVREIGTELDVAYVLEGSVRKMGDNLRIITQLIDANTGDHVWSENYDGKYTEEIFKLQTNLAKKVASSLHAVITLDEQERIEKNPTSDIIAYDYFLKGKYEFEQFYLTRHEEHIKMAHDLFDKALEIDPEFLYALNWKGETYIAQAKVDSARFYADKILAIDPGYSGANMIKAECYFFESQYDLAIENYLKVDQTYPEYFAIPALIGRAYSNKKNSQITALRYFQKSIDSSKELKSEEFNPTRFTYRNIGVLFLDIGLYDYAEKYQSKANKIRLYCHSVNLYNWTLTIRSKYEKAFQYIDSIGNLGICQEACYMGKFHLYLLKGELNEAEQQIEHLTDIGISLEKEVERLLDHDYVDEIMLAYLYIEIGKKDAALEILGKAYQRRTDRLIKTESWHIYLDLSLIHAIQGQNEEALKYLDEAINLGLLRGWHDFIEIHPIYKNLQEDPEFKALVKKAQDEKAAIREEVLELLESGEITL
jgi:TolB-like protein